MIRLILLNISNTPVLTACISTLETSVKAKPPTTTVPVGEKFLVLSSMRRNAIPLAEEGVPVPSEPISCTDSTRMIRSLYRLGFSCVTVISNVHRPPLTRSRDTTFRSVRLSCEAVNKRYETASSAPASRPIDTVKLLLPVSVVPTPVTAVPVGTPDASSHWMV